MESMGVRDCDRRNALNGISSGSSQDNYKSKMVESKGVEPLTSSVQARRSSQLS